MVVTLMERWEPGTDVVLWRAGDGHIQPMYGFYVAICMEALGGTIRGGNYRLMKFLNAVRYIVVDTSKVHIPDIWFANMNPPSTYRNLRELYVPVMAISGRRNTGKAALLEMLVKGLTRVGIRSVVTRHDGHEFEAGVPRTDNQRVEEARAYSMVVYSGTKFSMTRGQPSMETENFLGFFPEANIIFLEGQKYLGAPKLEVLRKGVPNVPVYRPETMLAYIRSEKNGWSENADPAGESRRNGKCPVFTAGQKDRVLEVVIEHMDGYSRGDEGDEL